MRKLVSLLLATLLCVSLLTGCANNVDSTQPTNSVHDGTGTSTETREKVVLWMSGDDARYLVESGLVEKFNEKNEKYYVELVEMTFDTLHDKLLAGAASGEVPAVSQGADQWVGEFAYLDALMPLDDLISEYGFKEEDFADNAWEHFRYLDGHIYAAPFYLENRVLYYRTDILEEAGFDGPPETWDEVFEYAKVLSNGEDKFTMGHQDGWLDFHFFSCLLYSYGGDFYNKERTECILNNEQGLKALKYYEALYDQNVIPKDADKRVEAFKGFKEGYYAMVESGNWWIGLIENQAPELEGKWAMAYLPTGDTTTVYGHPNGWIIPKNSPNPEGAMAWIDFVLQTDTEILMSNAYGLSPISLEAYDDPSLKNADLHKMMRDVSKRGTDSIHNIPNAEAISELVWNMLADVRDDVKTPEDALNDVVKQINPLLTP